MKIGNSGPDNPSGDRRLLATGLVGTVVTALCCFTPLLVVLLGVVGMSAVLGWIDYVLMPALALFVALTVYALWRRRRCLEAGQKGMTR